MFVIASCFTEATTYASAVAGLVKINQLKQKLFQDRTVTTAEINLAEMLFWVGSMVDRDWDH